MAIRDDHQKITLEHCCLRLAQAAQSKAVARLQTLDPRELSPSDLLRYIQVATEMERRAVGEVPVTGPVEDRDQGADVGGLSDEDRRARMDQLRRELERRLSEGGS